MTTDDELSLPDLQDAVLSSDTLAALLNDIEHCTELLELRVKTRAHGHSNAGEPCLKDIPVHLLAGHAVQLRYRHFGQQWLDTLIPTPRGTRLVRIKC